MARFVTYAEVITADHPLAGAVAPEGKRPGRALREILADHGADWARIHVRPDVIAQLRDMARMPGNEHLRAIAEATSHMVSLDHLRNLDPDTRVIVGYRIDYTEEESIRLGLYDPEGPA